MRTLRGTHSPFVNAEEVAVIGFQVPCRGSFHARQQVLRFTGARCAIADEARPERVYVELHRAHRAGADQRIGDALQPTGLRRPRRSGRRSLSTPTAERQTSTALPTVAPHSEVFSMPAAGPPPVDDQRQILARERHVRAEPWGHRSSRSLRRRRWCTRRSCPGHRASLRTCARPRRSHLASRTA